jgi:hypothetical protein
MQTEVLDPNSIYETEADDGYPIDEYDIIASPNDFNIRTIYDYMEKGVFLIPGYQRNYVWDIKRASKLIESLLVGIPVPPIYLYEMGRNKYQVIDGQQRLLTIYYFLKGRFPRLERRSSLRAHMSGELNTIPVEIWEDDTYFEDFKLRLPLKENAQRNRFHDYYYEDLGEYKERLDLRTIRNYFIRQVAPANGDGAAYEIFNRFNSGGVNLSPQEIRASFYYSDFYQLLYELNSKPQWRAYLGDEEPDLHLRDVEYLLRAYAILMDYEDYGSSLMRFLNSFSKKAQKYSPEDIRYLRELFESVLQTCADLPLDIFYGESKRFSILLFESVFFALARPAYEKNGLVYGQVVAASIEHLKQDRAFQEASALRTTNKKSLLTRLERAQALIGIRG